MSGQKGGGKAVASGISVMIRVRPFNQREKNWFESKGKEMTPVIYVDSDTVTVLDPERDYQPKDAYAYNNCYWSCVGYDSPNGIATQADVYASSGRVLLDKALEGYNGTVFAYGQTGSGKTYSMLGAPGSPGISYLCIRDLFEHIEQEKVDNPGATYTVEISFMEIYNEQVRDLFNKNVKAGQYSPVKIRQHPVLGIQVEGLERMRVHSAAECEKTMERGVNERTLAETKMNATSSRSHAICQISILQTNAKTGLQRNSLINVVDLAGSERLKMTGAQGQQLTEAKNINQSLSTLRKVFDVIIENQKRAKKQVPPYRESMLTWVLKESLGGNSITTMIAAVSPCEESIEDTISTLRYAQKAKAIMCKVIQNEQPNHKMVTNLKEQVQELQKQLAEKLAAGDGEVAEETKESIRHEFEEQIQASEDALKDAEEAQQEMEEKQEALRIKVGELELREAEVRRDLGIVRKQKFSAAFRSAFVIKRERTEVREKHDELKVQLREEQQRTDDLLRAKQKIEQEREDLRRVTEEEKNALSGKNEILSTRVASLEHDNATMREKIRACCCKALNAEVVQLRDALKLAQAKGQGLEETCQVREVEREKDERRLRARIDEQAQQVRELRRASDEYKKKYMALRRMHESDTKIIQSMATAGRDSGVSFASPLLRLIDTRDEANLSPIGDADGRDRSPPHSGSPTYSVGARRHASGSPAGAAASKAGAAGAGAAAPPSLSAINRLATSLSLSPSSRPTDMSQTDGNVAELVRMQDQQSRRYGRGKE